MKFLIRLSLLLTILFGFTNAFALGDCYQMLAKTSDNEITLCLETAKDALSKNVLDAVIYSNSSEEMERVGLSVIWRGSLGRYQALRKIKGQGATFNVIIDQAYDSFEKSWITTNLYVFDLRLKETYDWIHRSR